MANITNKLAVLALSASLAFVSAFTVYGATSPAQGGTTTQNRRERMTQQKAATSTSAKTEVTNDIVVTKKSSQFLKTTYRIRSLKGVSLKILVSTKTEEKIPDIINSRKGSYLITVISTNAFSNASKVRTLKIGKNICWIKKKAFNGSKIKTLKFVYNKVPKIESLAFVGSNIKKIIIGKKMSSSNYRILKKRLKNAGFKGKIIRQK